MEWFAARVQLLVRELGTTQYREITVPQALKTKSNIESQIQEAFFNQKVAAVSVGSRALTTDQDYSSLVNGQKLEVTFANKVPTTVCLID
jgi:hypothetical protein